MTDKTKIMIRLYCTSGFASCDHVDYLELDRKEWDSMTKGEQDKYLNLCASAHLDNFIDYGAYVVEDEDK